MGTGARKQGVAFAGVPLEEAQKESAGNDLPFYRLRDVMAATNNFSAANKIGQGGFGPVYRGELRGGQEVAIKRLSRVSKQGLDEFMNELKLIAKLQHTNLVQLLGCCAEGEERILIYEYMPNKSLDHFLFDPILSKQLGWEKRFEIVMGIARGLQYLHQESRLKIIHRDLKTSNILLDAAMNPRISDFGLARIFCDEQSHISTMKIAGTCGYMPPEYAMEGRYSTKSDVFSFGVIVLEVVSGLKMTSFRNE
ncbi:G-type lectin S-receptor-like serine/threonine-protein kinase, partial [Nymphaea thermarum]